MSNRNEVYDVLNAERDYQDNKWPATDGISATPEGFLLVIDEIVGEAKKGFVYTPVPKDRAVILNLMRKIGATAIRAMEQHGAIARNV